MGINSSSILAKESTGATKMTPTKDQKAGLITNAAIEAAAQDIVAKIVERVDIMPMRLSYYNV